MILSRKVAFGSLWVSLTVLIIKGVAYQLTGSVALFSDALESVINVATAIAAIVAIRYASQPPDKQHPFGHQKAEYLSAIVIGVMIVIAGVAILREAYEGFLAPKPIDAPLLGLAVSSVATLMNALWSGVLIRQGRRHRSAALVADGKHLLADVVTSVGVVIGVGLVVITRIHVLDAVIAALVAVHVLWSGWEVIRENSGGYSTRPRRTKSSSIYATSFQRTPKKRSKPMRFAPDMPAKRRSSNSILWSLAR